MIRSTLRIDKICCRSGSIATFCWRTVPVKMEEVASSNARATVGSIHRHANVTRMAGNTKRNKHMNVRCNMIVVIVFVVITRVVEYVVSCDHCSKFNPRSFFGHAFEKIKETRVCGLTGLGTMSALNVCFDRNVTRSDDVKTLSGGPT